MKYDVKLIMRRRLSVFDVEADDEQSAILKAQDLYWKQEGDYDEFLIGPELTSITPAKGR